MSIYEQYETVIGLEVHIQLATESKAFCTDPTSFGAAPNTQISPVSLGHPGTLPRMNKRQIEYAVKLGLALGCEINRENQFARKNYFYVDLPKGYQITQDDLPICVGGSLKIRLENSTKDIRIHRIHMEEDAGKSIHDQAPKHSLVDLNRAGVPLLEMVSEPDFRSSEEVYSYMSEVRKIVRYLGISDGNMEEGSLRCDVNVSVRKKGDTKLGTRCEVKNVNSLRYAKRAVEFEFKRQVDIIEAGGTITQSTLNFDPATGRTSPMREKENAHDYRYFTDPDLPPVILTDEFIEDVRASLPPLPEQLVQQFTKELGLPEYDALVLTEERSMAEFYLALIKHTKQYKTASNWVINIIKAYLNEEDISIEEFPLSPRTIAALMALVESKKVSFAAASQKLFPALTKQPQQEPEALAKSLNLMQDSDAGSIEHFVDQALAKFPDKVKAYKKGKKGVIGLFMGEVMKLSRGKANPQLANQLLRKKLEEA